MEAQEAYKELMRLLDDVEINEEYLPVEHQPRHSVIKSDADRERERYREDSSYHLGDIERSILGLLCYDA